MHSEHLHEAGHAVVLMALGRPFARVTESAVKFGPGNPEPDKAIIHLAGVAAETIAGGDGEAAWRRAKRDGDEARRCTRQALEARGIEPTKEAIEALLEAEWKETWRILSKNWPAVRALASELAYGPVGYRQARLIFLFGA